ncbi:hypothetical protein DLJ54_04275 [Corynebacterium heidelbergense]|uniref:Uncharacterized protein n=1 Tax=Corynebacterium heidelbergense TaxID=2055947 RepID=A0A364V6G5_9CORY|nr:hypothetical protein DLJ54_04275 [Corynebacterium heidelbergense]
MGLARSNLAISVEPAAGGAACCPPPVDGLGSAGAAAAGEDVAAELDMEVKLDPGPSLDSSSQAASADTVRALAQMPRAIFL